MKLDEISEYNTKNWNELYVHHSPVKYPHEQLVIYVNYLRQKPIHDNQLKALEIGFGSIADMVFLNNMGYEVYGLEVSENAVCKAFMECERLNVRLNLNFWRPPELPFEDGSFDFFCSSNAIHFNLNQEVILSEIHRILNDNGKLYTTYLAPGHKFIDHSKYVGENMIQFTEGHYVPKMRNMVMCYFDDALKLEALYKKYFKEVRVTRLEYNILDAPNAYWIVTASKT